MLFNLTLTDGAKKVRGSATLRLVWGSNKWFIVDDPQQAWRSVGTARSGRFEQKSWGVVWVWSEEALGQKRNPLILWDAPRGEIDSTRASGRGRLFDPLNPAFKDGDVQWAIRGPAVLSDRRKRVLELIDKVLNCTYMDENYERIAPGLRKNSPGVIAAEEWSYEADGVTPKKNGDGSIVKKRNYTTCGSLPGYVSKMLGAPDGLSLNGTNIVRDKGIKYNAWVEATGENRPLPGDIYVLLDKQNKGVSHVGVIQDATGNVWTTADMGQGGGWDGKKGTKRAFNPATIRLSGEMLQGGGDRRIPGWLDLDRYPFPLFPVHKPRKRGERFVG
jgi:hypothetical protein